MKKKKKFILFALLSLLPYAATSVCAQDGTGKVVCMVLAQNDGSVTAFALSDQPVVTYEGDNIVVTCGDQRLTTSLEGIDKWTFSDDAQLGIGEGQLTEPQVLISFARAEFSGLKSGAVVGIYAIDGKAIFTKRACEDGQVSVDLGHLPGGVYIVRTPYKSYKIKK